MKRVFIYVFIAVALIGALRVHMFGEGQKGERLLSDSNICDTYSGFVYRAPWNTETTLLFICADFSALIYTYSLSQELIAELSSGRSITLTNVEYKLPNKQRNPNTFDYALYLKTRGVALVCTPKQSQLQITDDKLSLAYILHMPGARFRAHVRNVTDKYLSDDTSPIVTAVMTGDSGSMDEESKSRYRDSGLSHLMAVSGMHVTFILMPFRALGRNRRVSYGARNLILIPPLIIFLALADYSPSVMRACVTAMLTVTARVCARSPDRLNQLFASASLQTLINPYSLINTGFLLSYGAVLSILLIQPRLEQRYPAFAKPEYNGRNAEYIRIFSLNSISAGIAVNIGLLPLMLYTFGSCSLIGLILTVYMSFPAFLICVTGYCLCLLDFARFIHPLCVLLSWFVQGVAAAFNFVTEKASLLMPPLGRFEVNITSAATVILIYAVIIAAVIGKARMRGFILRADAKLHISQLLRVHFLRGRLRKRSAIAAISCAVFVIASFTTYCNYKISVIRALVIDVGQGASTLVQADGYCGLIDTGDGRTQISQVLKASGVRRLDFVVLTHGHDDHTGGYAALAEEYSPPVLFVSGNEGDVDLRVIAEEAESQGADVRVVSNGDTVTLGDVVMEFIVCDSFFGENDDSDVNNSSLCVRFTSDYGSMLVCGDLESEAESAMCDEGVFTNTDVLVVPHHGSATAAGEKMLSNIQPEYAIISVGALNRYGHPHESTLERLDLVGADVYRTDLCGGITVQIGRQTLFRRSFVEVWQTY